MKKRAQVHTFFAKQFSGDPPWSRVKRLLQVGINAELDELVKKLRFKKRT
jgi:hypothetical protein